MERTLEDCQLSLVNQLWVERLFFTYLEELVERLHRQKRLSGTGMHVERGQGKLIAGRFEMPVEHFGSSC